MHIIILVESLVASSVTQTNYNPYHIDFFDSWKSKTALKKCKKSPVPTDSKVQVEQLLWQTSIKVRVMLLCLTPIQLLMLLDRLCGFWGLFTSGGRFCVPIFLFVGHPCGAIFDPLGNPACLLLTPPLVWPFLP